MSLITKILPIRKSDDLGTIPNEDLNLHDCLTDDVDWNAEYWDFHPNCMSKFANVIKDAYVTSTDGVIFQALWVGDAPEITIELTIEQFISVLSENKVATHAAYIIHKNA